MATVGSSNSQVDLRVYDRGSSDPAARSARSTGLQAFKIEEVEGGGIIKLDGVKIQVPNEIAISLEELRGLYQEVASLPEDKISDEMRTEMLNLEKVVAEFIVSSPQLKDSPIGIALMGLFAFHGQGSEFESYGGEAGDAPGTNAIPPPVTGDGETQSEAGDVPDTNAIPPPAPGGDETDSAPAPPEPESPSVATASSNQFDARYMLAQLMVELGIVMRQFGSAKTELDTELSLQLQLDSAAKELEASTANASATRAQGFSSMASGMVQIGAGTMAAKAGMKSHELGKSNANLAGRMAAGDAQASQVDYDLTAANIKAVDQMAQNYGVGGTAATSFTSASGSLSAAASTDEAGEAGSAAKALSAQADVVAQRRKAFDDVYVSAANALTQQANSLASATSEQASIDQSVAGRI